MYFIQCILNNFVTFKHLYKEVLTCIINAYVSQGRLSEGHVTEGFAVSYL